MSTNDDSKAKSNKPTKALAPMRPATHQPRGPKPERKKRKKVRGPKTRLAIGLLRLVVFGYAAILVTLIMMEDRLVYPGAFMADDTVAPSESPVETVVYESPGRIALAGRLLERPQCENYILFFHGNGTKARWVDTWLETLSEQCNATVLAAEYRGFEDNITPSERGVLEDCFAARDYLCERYQIQPTDIILYGRSLGGGCAVAVASLGGAKALVLESTFDRLFSVAAEKYPIIPTSWLMKNRFDSVAKLTAYKGPLIQVHGLDDTVVPFERGMALYETAKCQPKCFLEFSGVDHNDDLPPSVVADVMAKLREFISESQ